MAHMACKNAISNIYFELGEFQELNMQLLFRCSPTLNPFERDAQQIWLNLSFFLLILLHNVYNLFNLNLKFESGECNKLHRWGM